MEKFEKCGKINFVDENGVFVGFSNTQDCCEDFGWNFIAEKPLCIKTAMEAEEVILSADALKPFHFDKEFCETFSREEYDESHAVVFKLVSEDREVFLVFYNTHNGYYGHGFDMVLEGINLHSGVV